MRRRMRGQGGAWPLVCGLWAPGDPQFESSLPVARGALPRATDEFPSYSWELAMENKMKTKKVTNQNPKGTDDFEAIAHKNPRSRRKRYNHYIPPKDEALGKSKVPLNVGNIQGREYVHGERPPHPNCTMSKEELKKMSSILPVKKFRSRFVYRTYFMGQDPDEVMKNMLSEPEIKNMIDDLELTGCGTVIPAKFKKNVSQHSAGGKPRTCPKTGMGALANQGSSRGPPGKALPGPSGRADSRRPGDNQSFTQQCQRLISNISNFGGSGLGMIPLVMSGVSSELDGMDWDQEPRRNDMEEPLNDQRGPHRIDTQPRTGQVSQDGRNSAHRDPPVGVIADLPGVDGPLKQEYERFLSNVNKIGGFGSITLDAPFQKHSPDSSRMPPPSEPGPSSQKRRSFSDQQSEPKKARFMGERVTGHIWPGETERGLGPMREDHGSTHQSSPVPSRRPPFVEERVINQNNLTRAAVMKQRPGPDSSKLIGSKGSIPSKRTAALEEKWTSRPDPHMPDRTQPRRGQNREPHGNMPFRNEVHGNVPPFSEGSQGNMPPFNDGTQGNMPPFNNRPHGDVPPFNNEFQGNMPPFNNGTQGNMPPFSIGSQGNMPPFNYEFQGNMPLFNNGPQGNMPPFNSGPHGNMPPFSGEFQGNMQPFNNRPQGNMPSFNNGSHGDVPVNNDFSGNMPPLSCDSSGTMHPGLSRGPSRAALVGGQPTVEQMPHRLSGSHDFGSNSRGIPPTASPIPTNRSREETSKDGEPRAPLFIVPTRYPSERFSDKQMDAIENSILDAILEIDDERMKPTFQDSFRNKGRYGVICNDQLSKNWLFNYLSKCRPWPYASFKIISAGPTKMQAEALLPLCKNDDNDKILKFIAKQNTKLNVSQWEVVQRVDGVSNTSLSLGIDEESARVLKDSSTINFKMGRAEIIVQGGSKANHNPSSKPGGSRPEHKNTGGRSEPRIPSDQTPREMHEPRLGMTGRGRGSERPGKFESHGFDRPEKEPFGQPREMIQLPTPPPPPALGDAMMLLRRSPEYEPSRSDRFFRTPSPEPRVVPTSDTTERSRQGDPSFHWQALSVAAVDRSARSHRTPTSGGLIERDHSTMDRSITTVDASRNASSRGSASTVGSNRIPTVGGNSRGGRPPWDNPNSDSQPRSGQLLPSRSNRQYFPSRR